MSVEAKDVLDEYDCEAFFYSGEINEKDSIRFLCEVLSHRESSGQRRGRGCLFLVTYGGDLHAAARIAKAMQQRFSFFRLVVTGPCASAGTLVATAADEIVVSPVGELGPMDIQVLRPDELSLTRHSGLDTTEAFNALSRRTFSAFESYLLRIVQSGGGLISTKMAAELASGLVDALIQPIAAQIDPYRLAEADRMMNIAAHYGNSLERGNPRMGAIDRLVHGFPDHRFIIDKKEAEKLFHEVRHLNEHEATIVSLLGDSAFTPERDTVSGAVASILEELGGENEAESDVASGEDDSVVEGDGEQEKKAGRPRRTSKSRSGTSKAKTKAKG
ncbi:MAG: hypothetical protein AAGC60_00370 [Acidobacteriota bacterium]